MVNKGQNEKIAPALIKKYGPDYFSKLGSTKKPGNRGYFGKLKDQGKTTEIGDLGRKGANSPDKTSEDRSAIRVKGWETRRSNRKKKTKT